MDCRYGYDCFKEGCSFVHPEGRKIDNKIKGAPHMGHHGGPPMFYPPPQGFYPGQPPMYYPQAYYGAPYMYPAMEPIYDAHNYEYDNYGNYEDYYNGDFQASSSGEYVLDKEITPEMEEDFFEFQEGHQQDPDTWIPERRDCKCCQGYVYKCEDKTCTSLGVCVCHYEHDDNTPSSSTPSTPIPSTTSTIQVSSAANTQTSAPTVDTRKYVPPHLRGAATESETDSGEEYFDSKANCSCCKGYIYTCKTPTCVMMGICGCQYCHSEPTVNDLKQLLSHTKSVDDNSYQEILRISLTKENYANVFSQVIDAIASFPDRHSVYANLISKLKQVNRNIFEDAAELTALKRNLLNNLFAKVQPFIGETQSDEQNTEIYKAYFKSFEPLIEAKLITAQTLNKVVSTMATSANVPLILFILEIFKKHLTVETKSTFTKQFKDKPEFKDTFASWS